MPFNISLTGRGACPHMVPGPSIQFTTFQNDELVLDCSGAMLYVPRRLNNLQENKPTYWELSPSGGYSGTTNVSQIFYSKNKQENTTSLGNITTMALTLDLLHYEIGQKHVLNCLVPRSQLLLQAQPVKSYANVVQDPFYNVFKRMKYGGTTTCPQGYRQITDVKTCEEAKKIFEDNWSYQGIVDNNSAVGCYQDKLHQRFYIAPGHPENANHMRVICLLQPTCIVSYELQGDETSGFVQVSGVDSCPASGSESTSFIVESSLSITPVEEDSSGGERTRALDLIESPQTEVVDLDCSGGSYYVDANLFDATGYPNGDFYYYYSSDTSEYAINKGGEPNDFNHQWGGVAMALVAEIAADQVNICPTSTPTTSPSLLPTGAPSQLPR